MSDIASERRTPAAAAILILTLILALLALPAALIAIASGLGLLALPYPLVLVLRRLPLVFPLHMIAAGLALILIPIAAAVRHDPRIHRPVGRIAAICVCVGAVTALAVAIASEASLATRAGFFAQGLVWLALLVAAVVAIRRHDRARHARLMLAMAAVASGAVWLRLTLSGAMALELPFDTVYPVAAWLCWIVPLAVTLVPRLMPFPNKVP
jgi:uncharacterized membrane protein YozB (DUF420 family)